MITLDDRTGSVDLLPYFPSGTARLGRLGFGDASFVGKGKDDIPVMVGVERKTLSDLVGSLESGRFSGHQLPGLLASYNTVYLVIEGIGRVSRELVEVRQKGEWRSLGVSELALDNFLNTLEVMAGVIIRQTNTPQRTAYLIRHLYQWWDKGWDSHKSHLVFYDPRPTLTITKPGLVRRIAKELPGIGWTRSGPVSKHFGSVREMVLADHQQWEEIEGIGKGLAGRVVEAINGSH